MIDKNMLFETKKTYHDRATKAEYLYDKYKTIFKGKILDVGGGDCYLKKYLNDGQEYICLDSNSSNADLHINLDVEALPFSEDIFDVVLCIDVLEHLENIYNVFDELCRVVKRNIIISLPNPYESFINFLKGNKYKPSQDFKQYGLPAEQPVDRHRWFFSAQDAKRFIIGKAKQNNMNILQIDFTNENKPGKKLAAKLMLVKWLSGIDLNKKFFYCGSIWAILEKKK